MGQEVIRLSYSSESLEESYLIDTPVKHKDWKMVKLSEAISHPSSINEKTVVLVDSALAVTELRLPKNVELHFCGGSLRGSVSFVDTYLSGKINLRESILDGSVSNEIFEAGWVCYGDGIHDDAFGIQQALNVCNTVHFVRGTYLLSSYHTIWDELPTMYHELVKSHIGIYRDNITLYGDQGVSFLVKEPGVAICVYSRPYDIKHSTNNVIIDGLTFRNENNGDEFYEYIHAVKLAGVNKFSLTNCKFFDFWGDAICLSHYGDTPKSGERTRNRNVNISNNYIDGISHNNRNGISVISGKNILIEGNTIIETSKTNMPGAIDIEANNSAYKTERIIIRNNIIQGCTGGVGAISIVSNNQEAPAKHITIQSNLIKSSAKGICVLVESKSSTEDFKILDNTFNNCDNPIIFRGKGKSKNWVIKGNSHPKLIRQKTVGDIQVTNLRTDRNN